MKKAPVVIIGGNGYVSGELLRLLALHPRFQVLAVTSTSQAGEGITQVFPHLSATSYDSLKFSTLASLVQIFEAHKKQEIGVFLATPHGATAALAVEVLAAAKKFDVQVRLVDLSADFRFQDHALYEEIYGVAHAAPGLLPAFHCGIPDLDLCSTEKKQAQHYAHAGCFTTSVVLAAAPFFAEGCVESSVFIAAVTGSSGSGRKVAAGTHHPERRSNFSAYSPLHHRHAHEMRILLGEVATDKVCPEIHFIPHSGPFARGIHATLQMRLKVEMSKEQALQMMKKYYAHTPFVQVSEQLPQLIEVAGTHRCRLSVAIDKSTLVVFSAIDNMVKGSAGGGVQFMNRHFGFEEATGLQLPGLGWY